MNATDLAHQAYAPNQSHIRTPRSIEAELVSDITRRLSRPGASFSDLVQAVHDNRRMWTALAIDVADTENALPAELRASIFYLAEFTDIQSQKFLNRRSDLAPLIEINTAVLRGLRGREVSA